MTVAPEKLRIDLYPTEVLRAVAAPVEVNEETVAVAQRMIGLMHGAEGIGLAAPQVGLSWRLFVAHVPPPQGENPGDPPVWSDAPEVFFNPEIVERSSDLESGDEGCLSLPGITGEVARPSTILMRALNERGEPVERRAAGLLARCFQHEIDHLDGVLILDKMTQASRLKNRSRIKALERSAR